jgi:hypothetical protein
MIRYNMKYIFVAYLFDVIDVNIIFYKVGQIYKSLIYDSSGSWWDDLEYRLSKHDCCLKSMQDTMMMSTKAGLAAFPPWSTWYTSTFEPCILTFLKPLI